MSRLGTAWKGVGGLVFGLVLTVFALAPGLDAMMCGTEAPAAESAGVHAHANPDEHAGADCGADCRHGHCHHGAAVVAAVSPIAEAIEPPAPAYAVADAADPAFDLRFGLKRPPRA